jgi:hypothetical protein
MNAAGTLTVVHHFNGANGANPRSGLLKTTGTNFYGTTLAGGAAGVNGLGVIYHLGNPVAFTDDPLVAGTSQVRAIHVTELRSRIDEQRVRFGLTPYAWTDATLTVGSTPVKAVHLTDLRTAMSQTYAAAGLAPPSYTDAITAGSTVVRVVHIAELRSLIQAIE